MAITMFEITKEMERLETLVEALYDQETGELIEGAHEAYEELQQELAMLVKNKSGGIIKALKMKKAMMESTKQELENLKAHAKRQERDYKRLESYLIYCLENMDIKKVETPNGVITVKKSISTIINEDLIDEKYGTLVEVAPKLTFSKTEIKKRLQDGEIIVGANLQENTTLNIK